MNSFCWPRLLTFCRVFCCSACLCCLCMCSSVWHVKVTDELRFCVIYQPFLEVQSQWCATKRDIKCKKKCRKHFCFVFMHVLTHISSFCVLAASTGVSVCTWFNIFPLKYFHGSNCTHSQQKHIFFVLPKCLQNLYQTESSPPCAINPE